MGFCHLTAVAISLRSLIFHFPLCKMGLIKQSVDVRTLVGSLVEYFTALIIVDPQMFPSVLPFISFPGHTECKQLLMILMSAF